MSNTVRHLRHAFTILCTLALLSGHALAEDKTGSASASSAHASVADPGVVNINTATPDELGRLPGIGPAKADAIVALRTRVKRFQRIEQLMRVRGIGRKTFRKLRPMLTIAGPTTLHANEKASKASKASVKPARPNARK